MEPVLTWLDLTAADRDKMRRVLDLFDEKGTIDELGLGTLRDALSNALFPGTSSIQTRLRYVLFVPWIYQGLERERVRSTEVAGKARKAEINLIEVLNASDDNAGVIGRRAKAKLLRLPSSVYWVALVHWGIFLPGQSQSWYHTHFDSVTRGGTELSAADDPGVVFARQASWHPRLPTHPSKFPKDASFDLTRDEAVFVRGRIEERCGRTLLAHMAAGSTEPAPAFWDDAAVEAASQKIKDTVELARRFSLHVEAAPLLYNLMLAEERLAKQIGEADEATKWIDHYQSEIAAWADREATEAPFDVRSLWAFMATRGDRVPDRQRRFIEGWSARCTDIGPDRIGEDPGLRQLITEREIQLKGARARLANHNRLLDWNGSVGVGRMDFRWGRVRELLRDLHAGLGH